MLASNGLTTPPWGVPQVLLLPPLTHRVPSLSRSSTALFIANSQAVEQTPGRTDSVGQFVLPVAKPDNADANVRSE
jgi:hypothetical protein